MSDPNFLGSEWYKQAFDEATVAMGFIDSGWRFVRANEAFCKMFGYPSGELLGKSILELTHPDDVGRTAEKLGKVFSGTSGGYRIEKRYISKSGDVIWGLVSIFPVKEKGGKVVYCFGVIEDITHAKKLETALKESELLYHGLVELSPDGIAVHAEGKVLFVNQAGAKMLGAEKAEEIVGKPTLSFVHPESQKIVVERIKKMLEDNKPAPLTAEKFVRLDGGVIDVEVAASPITYSGQKAVQVVIHDLTEQKKTQKAVSESEARYRGLAEAAHDMIFVLDRTGTITYVNSFAAGQFGLRPEDMVGRKRAEFFGPAAETQDISLRKVFESGESFYRETRTPFKDKTLWLGTWLVPLKKDDEVTGILGVSRDISAQKETELGLMKLNRTLKESEESYHGLFDSVGEAVYIQDADGKFLDVNPGAVRMYGHPREWFIGRSPLDVAAPGKNDLPKIKAAVERAFAGEPQEFEFWGVRSSGEVFPKDVRLYKGTYFGKEVVMALATDITARKEQERQRDEFVMIASHELRAPMTAIRWQISMILDGTYGPIGDRLGDPLAGMMVSADRLIELVGDMISTSRIEGGGLKLAASDFDIKKMLDDLTGTFGSEVAKKGLAFDLSGVKSMSVRADVDKTAQILSNLIDNAIKFTDDDGKISLGAEVAGDRVRITVADTGVGIPPDFNDKLFGKFAQAVTGREGKLRGTGLGLYISRELARAMGGDLILAESQVGKGSIFALILPTPTAKPA